MAIKLAVEALNCVLMLWFFGRAKALLNCIIIQMSNTLELIWTPLF